MAAKQPPIEKTEQPDRALLDLLEEEPDVTVEIIDGKIVTTPVVDRKTK
jgi:hypothetical protein